MKKATWGDDVGNEGDLAKLRRKQLGGMTLEKSELSRIAQKATWGDDVGKSEAYPNSKKGNLVG